MSNNNKSQEYPLNLLDSISDSGEWEFILPSDFMPTLAYVLATLTEREQAVIKARYKDCRTYQSIGKEFGVTKERIRQIEVNAIRKLKHPSCKKMLQYGVKEYYFSCEMNTAMREISRTVNSINKIIGAIENTDGAIDTVQKITKQLACEQVKEIAIDDLNLSARSRNCLRRAEIRTLGELTNLTKEQLKNVRYLGNHSFEEIISKIREYGLELRPDDDNVEKVGYKF